MSRIGKMPIIIPAGVEITFTDDAIMVKGQKGALQERRVSAIECVIEGNICTVNRLNEEKASKQLHGLYRQLINNMVVGVSQGFSKTLLMVGVGYRAEEKKGMIGLNLGFSTQFEYKIPDGITIQVEKQTTLIISGISKQQVGQVASEIRAIRPPEPYKGKGVKYSDEVIRRKEGKTGKK